MIVHLHVTGGCNLRCDYCYASPKTEARMDWNTARSALELACSQPGDVHLVFFGGEPLLERELLERVVAWCEQSSQPARFHFQLVTNGLLADASFAQWAAEHQVSISVSLDGCQQAHDRHRRDPAGEGSWERVTACIPVLREHNPYLHVQMVISPDTAALLADSVACVFALGVRFISTALDHRAAWDGRSLRELQKAYRRTAALYQAKTLRGDRFFLSCFDSRIRTRVLGPCKRQERCSAGTQQWSVAPSGRIYPCVQFVGADRGSHCAIGDVARGVDAEALARFEADSEQDKQECTGCALLSRCPHWCACVNWASTGSVRTVSPVLCEHERILIPISDSVATRLFQRRNSLFIHKHYHGAWPWLSAAEDALEELAR